DLPGWGSGGTVITAAEPGPASASEPTAAARPPPATRFARPLARIARVLAWGDGFVARWLPHESNPLAHSGVAANFALAVAIVSGVALLVWYSPSLQFAYA